MDLQLLCYSILAVSITVLHPPHFSAFFAL